MFGDWCYLNNNYLRQRGYVFTPCWLLCLLEEDYTINYYTINTTPYTLVWI